ncbi:DUF4097 family beta strand repeat-containing protein [Kitasatospora sp. NPDC051914]|uniref:DUF4097 family beta strand repeat-containing protein n=1 Tax=Kitasatospora sp. NPDC051914 TaxID=3154945 RepID=UPI00341DCA48
MPAAGKSTRTNGATGSRTATTVPATGTTASATGAATTGPPITATAAATTATERERKVWRVLAVAVLVLAVLTGCGTAWGVLAHRTNTASRTYTEPVTALELNTGEAQVRVSAGPADRATVVQRADWAVRRSSVEQSLDKGTLRISTHCRSIVGPVGPTGCGLLLDIRVPAGVPVHARATSGEVTTRGMAGDIRVETTSGAIRLDSVSGRVWAKASSGQITGESLTSANVRAVLTSGQLLLMFARPPDTVSVTATSGEIDVELPTDSTGYRIDARSVSGAVDVNPALRSDTATRRVDVATSSGQISVAKSTE